MSQSHTDTKGVGGDWLGTPVGLSFHARAFSKAGGTILFDDYKRREIK